MQRKALLELAQYQSQYCIPLFILTSEFSITTDIIYGATCTLVETSEKQLFVTSHHVWDRFLQMRQSEGARLAGYLGKNYDVFLLTGLRYLDGDRDTLDIAILHAPEADYLRFTDKRFFQIPTWPICKPELGEAAYVVGYSGSGRHVIPLDADLGRRDFRRKLDLGYSHFIFYVSSVSDRHFVLANERRDRIYALRDPGQPDAWPLAGMSGSPCFIIRNGIEYLVGFLYEGATSLDSIFLTHANFLQADGTLDHVAIPLWKAERTVLA